MHGNWPHHISLSFALAGALAPAILTGESLSWQACVDEAKVHNRAVQASAQALAQAKAQAAAGRAAYFPALSAEAGLSQGATGDTDPVTTKTVGLSASQNLFNGFNDLATNRNLAAQVRSAEAADQQARAQAGFDLAVAFDQALRAQEQARLAGHIVDRQKDNRDLVQLRYDAGHDNKGSLLLTTATYSQAEADLKKAQDALLGASLRLGYALGRRPLAGLQAEGTLAAPEPGPDPDYGALARDLPAVRQTQASVDAAEANVSASRSAFLPSLNAAVGLSRPWGGVGLDRASWSAGLTLSLPLFDGLGNLAKVDAAKAALAQAQMAREEQLSGQVVTLQSAFAAYRNAVAQAAVQAQALQAAQVRAEIGRAQYGQGLLDFNSWNQIETQLMNAQTQDLDSRQSAVDAWAAWQQTLGKGPLQ